MAPDDVIDRDDETADRFAAGGRSVGETSNPLLETADGHPQRAIMLAHHLWERVRRGGTATLADWSAAHGSVTSQLEPEFDAQWRRPQPREQKVLRSVVAGGGSPYRQAVLDRLDLDTSTAQGAVKRLTAVADLEPGDRGKHRLVDPLFGEWIGRLDTGEPVGNP